MYNHESNNSECTRRGVCSIAPMVSSFQEVMQLILRTTVFYVLKLERMDYSCDDIKKDIIDSIANIVTTTIYENNQLFNLVISSYNNLVKLKRKYTELCKGRNIAVHHLKFPLKFTPDTTFNEILNQGEKLVKEKFKDVDETQKCFSELLFVEIKSVALSIMKLSEYKDFDYKAANQVLHFMNFYNHKIFNLNRYKNALIQLAKTDLRLWREARAILLHYFGNITETDVSQSVCEGKAILVSGGDLMDFYRLLETLKNEDISIYSHSDLLIAKSLDKFKEYKNFKGHYGSFSDNYILDFATFPGAIMFTKYATQNIEYLIRGRLFTVDKTVPKGVIKLNNFHELITSAVDSKGFTNEKNKKNITVGFNVDELEKKFEELKNRLESGEIKKIFVIGMSNYFNYQSKYFDVLIDNLPEDVFVITFSYRKNYKNLIFINAVNDFPLQLLALSLFFKKIPASNDCLTFFLTKCDSNTVSSMISLKTMGAKNIYLSDCPPTVINPSVMTTFMNYFDIKPMTNPITDLKEILQS